MQEQTEQITPNTEQTRGRWILALLFVFFAVPLLAVMLMHHYQWHPKGDSYGELVSPPVPLTIAAELLDNQGKAVTASIWHDKWSMVYVTGECDDICTERLHSMRQLHVSFAKDIERIQRILISPTHKAAELQQQYPDLLIINQPAPALPNLNSQFDIAGEAAISGNRIYLVDPLGNLMMSYPLSIAPAEIRKDMQRLLKYSWAG
ncbi:MAG: SCO family protein [Candidatus Methylopumilus sp.]